MVEVFFSKYWGFSKGFKSFSAQASGGHLIDSQNNCSSEVFIKSNLKWQHEKQSHLLCESIPLVGWVRLFTMDGKEEEEEEEVAINLLGKKVPSCVEIKCGE